ncbi:MAG: hypothetical protein IJZ61_01555 [Oscillospiraceae bacterium]|nr:hypothetical protein [Oscillospiraceae bacterium]
MERFTTMSTEGPHIKSGLNIRLHDTCVCSSTGPAVDRLYAYENTGLTPEEIMGIVNFDRLFDGKKVPDNAEACISATRSEKGEYNIVINGTKEQLVLIIAAVVHRMANGDISLEGKLLSTIQKTTADMSIRELHHNPKKAAEALQKLLEVFRTMEKGDA